MSLKVFNDFLHASYREAIAQQTALFNQATNGGIILRGAKNIGDFNDVAYWSRIAGLIRRRDAYGSGDVTAIDVDQLLATSVKVAAGTPPVNLPESLLAWIGRDPGEAGVVTGLQLAEDMMADFLNTAIAAFVAATAAQSAVLYDGTAGTLGLAGLNLGAAKFGDRAEAIKCWVIHSKVLFDMYGAAIANATGLFTFGNIKVLQDGFGRPFVVTDSPSLVYTSTGTKYRTLGLTPGGIVVEQNSDYRDAIETKTGKENINSVWQAEWSFQLALKGYTWDKTNGGASPTQAALTTATNWDKLSTSHKDLAGVLINSQ